MSAQRKLQEAQKGDRIRVAGEDQTVAGCATLHNMGRLRGQGPFVVIPGSPDLRAVWTADDKLIFIAPKYEKGDEVVYLLTPADPAKVDIGLLLQEAVRFGKEMRQAQETVSLQYDGRKFWFTDVGTAGGSDMPDDNQGGIVQGPAAALKFYHLTTDWRDNRAEHLFYMGPQTQDSAFSGEGGSVPETLWIGKIVDPEDVLEFEE